ncbi:MAG: leucyl aminopeptidase [Thermoleophilia bacterium]|nr:leucyl aminopeptidase [Thermoleophilia bacterium]
MREDSSEAVQLFREELELCGVEDGQTVAILAPTGSRHERANGFAAAAAALGAETFVLGIPPQKDLRGTLGIGHTTLAGRTDLLDLLKRADLVVDLAFIHFSLEQLELLAAGTRVLACVEPLDMLARLLPTRGLRSQVEAGAELMAAATELRVTSRAGTDATFSLTGGFPILTEYGFTDTPGRWDHWPAGFLATHASDNGVDGMVVLAPGDVVLLPAPRIVSSPVSFRIEAGYIVEIAGDGVDAMLVRDYFPDPHDDRDAFGVSHIGWGVNETARWELHPDPTALQMDLRSFAGNVLFSTGPNTDMGGPRDTPYHLDIPMRNCSLFLDGRVIVEDGRVVAGQLH